MILFESRADAGQRLARDLSRYADRDDVIVLGLPRGGVPVAFEVAVALHAPMDVFLVRKLGVPGREELAMGAIASGDVRVLNHDVVRGLGISSSAIERVATREREELQRRERAYRGDRPPPDVTDHIAILVDDGLATGASMRAAVAALRGRKPARVVVAVPVAPAETCAELRGEVDDLVCAAMPRPFMGVGAWYADFSQTTDDEVRDLLKRATEAPANRGEAPRPSPEHGPE